MKPIHIKLIKAKCLRFAVSNELSIDRLDDNLFLARSNDTVIGVEISHLFDQFQQGHTIESTLSNELSYLEKFRE